MENVIERADHIDIAFNDTEKELLEKARSMPITFDEDCPETTPEWALKCKRVNRPDTVAVR